ncbi:MAG TPA: GNAT family N-acetyltransferase [Spirochaetia bacterium]|nr:GNAT family N-acetyltransferase [Spirochaetia bacterium]
MPTTTFEKDHLIYRRATEKDIPRILGFVDIYLRKDWLVRRDYLWSTMHTDETWIVTDKKRVVAWATVGRAGRRGLWNLLVHPEYRNRGIGRTLVQRLKPDYIRSKSDQSDGDPAAFYARLGYETIKQNAGRKRNIQIMRRRKP